MTGIANILVGELDLSGRNWGRSYTELEFYRAERDRMVAAKREKFRLQASAQNLWRVAQGSNSAVLKKIHNGGTHTAKQLSNQLDYLFGKASTIFGNMVDHDPDARTLSPDERKAIVEQWSDEWTGDPKNGHTTHLLISFPADVGAKRIPPIVEQWAAELFQQGSRVEGEEWAYVAALHTDRANKHVHIVINNRGLERDTWFYMAKGHAFDLDDMKTRLVEIAADHGMFLDKSSRVDRGIMTYGPSRAEIERAGREGRAPVERPRQGRALADAMEQVEENARMLRSMASFAWIISDEDLALKIETAAETLENGGIIHPRNQEIIMDAETIKTRGDLASSFGKWLDDTEKDISRLPHAEQREMRSEFYQIAAEIVRDLGDDRGAQLMHHEARTALYQTQITSDTVSGIGQEKQVGEDGAREMKSRIEHLAEDAGLDRAKISERMSLGAANAWQEREWIKEDLLAVADAKKIDLSSEEGRGRVADIVDGFYNAAAKVISQAIQVDLTPENDRLTRTLGHMADSLGKHGKVEFQNDDDARRFGQDFRERYGQDSMTRIAEGDTGALAVDFPDENRRRDVAKAVVAAARVHQPVGLTLEQVKQANERFAEQESAELDHTRNKDLGHEL